MTPWREGLFTEGNLRIERLAIRKPIWDGRKVGVVVFRVLRADVIELRILYRLREGKALIPEVLTIPAGKVLEYPRQAVNGRELCIIPIADLLERKVRV